MAWSQFMWHKLLFQWNTPRWQRTCVPFLTYTQLFLQCFDRCLYRWYGSCWCVYATCTTTWLIINVNVESIWHFNLCWNKMISHRIYFYILFFFFGDIYLILFYDDNKYQKILFCIKWLDLCMKYNIKWMFTQ